MHSSKDIYYKIQKGHWNRIKYEIEMNFRRGIEKERLTEFQTNEIHRKSKTKSKMKFDMDMQHMTLKIIFRKEAQTDT